MRTTLYRLFWAWDFDKEEKWLNEMYAKGLGLVSVGFWHYTFEECLPGEYNIRLELLENTPSHPESQKYIEFLEETDAEYVGSIMRWVYFKKKTENGEFNVFSDNSSRMKHLNRILLLIGIFAIIELCLGFSIISMYFSTGQVVHLGAGIPLLCLGLLMGYGFMRINRKKRKLKKEQQLFE